MQTNSMRVQDIVEMNSHNKQAIYEAYSIEHAARKHLEGELSRQVQVNAGLRYDRDKFMEKWLRLHIKENVEIVGDMEVTLDRYFADPYRKVFFTQSGGYYCLLQKDDYLMIVFAWYNKKQLKQEYKDMPDLLHHIAQFTAQPIRFTGIVNVVKNHSVEIEPGLWELRL